MISISALRPALRGDNLLISLGVLRGVFLVNHLASTDKLTRTNKRQNTYKRKLNVTQKVALIENILKKTYVKRQDR